MFTLEPTHSRESPLSYHLSVGSGWLSWPPSLRSNPVPDFREEQPKNHFEIRARGM